MTTSANPTVSVVVMAADFILTATD